jgi:hypothetical protein
MRFRKNSAFAMLGVLAAGLTTRRLLERIWEENTSRPPPKDPTLPGVTWGQALLWGASAGLLAGLVRTVARRGLSEVGLRSR